MRKQYIIAFFDKNIIYYRRVYNFIVNTISFQFEFSPNQKRVFYFFIEKEMFSK